GRRRVRCDLDARGRRRAAGLINEVRGRWLRTSSHLQLRFLRLLAVALVAEEFAREFGIQAPLREHADRAALATRRRLAALLLGALFLGLLLGSHAVVLGSAGETSVYCQAQLASTASASAARSPSPTVGLNENVMTCDVASLTSRNCSVTYEASPTESSALMCAASRPDRKSGV